MRLRRPCEHGLYDDHSVYVTGFPAVDCPGGEFLPEDAEQILWCFEHRAVPSFVLSECSVATNSPTLLTDCRITKALLVLDAPKPDQVGEPG